MVDRLDNRPPIEGIYGTLPDWVVRHYIENELIKIDPLSPDWKEKMGSVTIDFHMGSKVLIPRRGEDTFVDVAHGIKENNYEEKNLDPRQLHILVPNQFIIVPTKEHLTLPLDIVGRLDGRSSLARLGLVVHLTAGRFDPGWNNYPVLELKNNSPVPIAIYEGFPICAFSFERLMAPVERAYTGNGRYNDDIIHSKIGAGDLNR